MNQLIVYFLLVYFVVFFGVAVVWRNYVVAKRTGINALKLNTGRHEEEYLAQQYERPHTEYCQQVRRRL